MIDTTVQIDGKKFVVESIIAEGGFGYVYKVRDQENNSNFALKKINSSDKETQSEIENEIDILRCLQKHPHIMEFFASAKVNPIQQDSNTSSSNVTKTNYKFTYLILCEYCDRGTLTDLGLPIQELERSCRILYQLAHALKHMHSLGIIHRDVKAENLLFDKNGRVKLCDFGSSTRDMYEPTMSWTRLQRTTVEEEMQRHTTPIYRAPEILETYLHYPIGCAIDVWAFGCLVYFMRFGQHAFPEGGKLSIVNCCYTIPKDVSETDPLVSIIRQCLKIDPRERISIQALINSFEVEFPEMSLSGSIIPFEPSSKHEEFGTSDQSKPPQESQKQDSESTPIQRSVTPENTSEPPQTPSQPGKVSRVGDMLIELASSPDQQLNEQSQAKKSSNLFDNDKDPAKKAGLPMELLEPSRKIDNIDLLLDMDNLGSKDISGQKVLSPKRAAPSSSSNLGDKADAFDDLLQTFGTTLPSNGATSTQKQVISNDPLSYDGFGFDPKLKIMEWKDSRRGNIRALLSSLHLVLSDEFRWKPIGMHQLVTDADVKKVYRHACLAIHPDKVINCDEDTKEVARMIFMELNEAWSKFEGK